MIDAYYSRGCDSYELFKDTEIATKDNFKKHMNQYNVIHLDMASFWDDYKDNIVEKVVEYIYKDFKVVFGESLDYESKISFVLMSIYQKTKIPFAIIIDEWDCVIRNSGNEDLVHKYLQFLHSLFKSEESKAFLALAYITGILPIKKIKDESALNNFDEYTMLKSKPITKYFGFTEEEVHGLCEKYDMDFDTAKTWYNGYLIDGIHMYNPNSVSLAMKKQEMAYFTAPAYYNIVREFPAGKGFADLVFIPRANAGKRPAMIIELKYNQSADSAISQIKERRYQGALSGYGNKILLVGVNYDADGEDKKKHTCVIEELHS